MIAAGLVALTLWLMLSQRTIDARRRVLAVHLARPDRPREGETARARLPARVMAPVLLGAGVAVAVGGAMGLLAGAVAAVGGVLLIRRAESAPERELHARLSRQAPLTCDLLAAVLASGTEPVSALGAVAAAIGEPARRDLDLVIARLTLGADARTAWRPLLGGSPLEPIAAAMVRSAESGAPLVESLRRAAADLRGQQRIALLARARVLGVRTVLPLGVCFLPAFVCLGIVPVVASLITSAL